VGWNSIGRTVLSIWIKRIAQNCGVEVWLLRCFLANPPLYVESMGFVVLFFVWLLLMGWVLSFINFLGFVLFAEFCCLIGFWVDFWLCRQ
jgi:undecaprenyl pyrophosphate phosphatase UppP